MGERRYGIGALNIKTLLTSPESYDRNGQMVTDKYRKKHHIEEQIRNQQLHIFVVGKTRLRSGQELNPNNLLIDSYQAIRIDRDVNPRTRRDGGLLIYIHQQCVYKKLSCGEFSDSNVQFFHFEIVWPIHLNIVAVHCPSDGNSKQIIPMLRHFVRHCREGPIIFIGDMNSNPAIDGLPLRRLIEQVTKPRDKNNRALGGDRYDHIICSNVCGLYVNDAEVVEIQQIFSDHDLIQCRVEHAFSGKSEKIQKHLAEECRVALVREREITHKVKQPVILASCKSGFNIPNWYRKTVQTVQTATVNPETRVTIYYTFDEKVETTNKCQEKEHSYSQLVNSISEMEQFISDRDKKIAADSNGVTLLSRELSIVTCEEIPVTEVNLKQKKAEEFLWQPGIASENPVFQSLLRKYSVCTYKECFKIFVTKDLKDEHDIKHHIICPYCLGKSRVGYGSSKLLQTHINDTHSCQQCSKKGKVIFNSPRKLKAHQKTHHKCKSSGCYQVFPTPKIRDEHQQKHLTYVCSNSGCNKTFKTRVGLESHKKARCR